MVAYRDPSADRTMAELQAKVTASGGAFDLAALTDGDLAEATLLPAEPPERKSWIQYEFPRAESISGVSLAVTGGGRGPGSSTELESSGDGREFHTVIAIPPGRADAGISGGQRTVLQARHPDRPAESSISTGPWQPIAYHPSGGSRTGSRAGRSGGRVRAPHGHAGEPLRG